VKFLQILVALLFGLFPIYWEFKPYEKDYFFYSSEVIKYPLILILTYISFKNGKSNYNKYKTTNRTFAFTPFFICIICLGTVLGHMIFRSVMDNSKSVFKAYGVKKVEAREDVKFDFKENGYLKVNVIYKFSDDYFWGSYKREGDTIFIMLKTDFELPNKGIIKGDTLRFIEDDTYYIIEHDFS
jgi:hypothetical protein